MPDWKKLLLLLPLTACSPTTPAPQATASPSGAPAAAVSFSVAQTIVNNRCVSCHSQTPTRPGFSSPAGGVAFDTPDQIKAKAARIKARSVDTTSMPQGNVTGMTAAEREQLGAWINAGANLQ